MCPNWFFGCSSKQRFFENIKLLSLLATKFSFYWYEMAAPCNCQIQLSNFGKSNRGCRKKRYSTFGLLSIWHCICWQKQSLIRKASWTFGDLVFADSYTVRGALHVLDLFTQMIVVSFFSEGRREFT